MSMSPLAKLIVSPSLIVALVIEAQASMLPPEAASNTPIATTSPKLPPEAVMDTGAVLAMTPPEDAPKVTAWRA